MMVQLKLWSHWWIDTIGIDATRNPYYKPLGRTPVVSAVVIQQIPFSFLHVRKNQERILV
jgi:hypothetical protein